MFEKFSFKFSAGLQREQRMLPQGTAINERTAGIQKGSKNIIFSR